MDDSSKDVKQKYKNNKRKKCSMCEFYRKKYDKCGINKFGDYAKTDFSKCESYQIAERLYNY